MWHRPDFWEGGGELQKNTSLQARKLKADDEHEVLNISVRNICSSSLLKQNESKCFKVAANQLYCTVFPERENALSLTKY